MVHSSRSNRQLELLLAINKSITREDNQLLTNLGIFKYGNPDPAATTFCLAKCIGSLSGRVFMNLGMGARKCGLESALFERRALLSLTARLGF